MMVVLQKVTMVQVVAMLPTTLQCSQRTKYGGFVSMAIDIASITADAKENV